LYVFTGAVQKAHIALDFGLAFHLPAAADHTSSPQQKTPRRSKVSAYLYCMDNLF